MKKTALLLVGLMAITTQSYALTLKVATLSPDGSAWMTKMRAGATEIETKTQKRVTFKFYTGGTMGNDKAVLNKIKIGQLQGGADIFRIIARKLVRPEVLFQKILGAVRQFGGIC